MTRFQVFVAAAESLSMIAAASTQFGPREKDAAAALFRNTTDACPVDECRQAFNGAYRVLGAPGDFGYGSLEGQGMQVLYACWNEALQGH